MNFNPFDDITDRLNRIERCLIAINERELSPLKNKAFYSPKEFSFLTGIKYSTVVYRCAIGKLKARQDGPSCSWQIDVEELNRYRKEANGNSY